MLASWRLALLVEAFDERSRAGTGDTPMRTVSRGVSGQAPGSCVVSTAAVEEAARSRSQALNLYRTVGNLES